MMRRPRLTFENSDGRGEQLAELMRRYAHTAYPPGGSECAATSRETLLDYAAKAADGSLAISSRQLPMIKAAIKWYYAEIVDDTMQRDRLLNAFQKHANMPKSKDM
ncbi:hypothetical protein [Solemya velum gill symbiont]|uniref:hypothetical protein n=2 Tax=Solemya velum gill symbiont TaxID=2340 RepID=UPI0009983B90|nr:hypothetical protein [Solemya velum gill symbiont]OOZ01242.1 hypothetical protein BOW20_06215 [Solemya velum gill symbiont]OOZ03453.1 hypothetical protein BOW21_06585 [Solemya velum gill symbiont]OOZ05707.1 hypothetical protein BOW22_06550 [Solemya velum gill symbiont]OOZ07933.1 hypothetical protein BOW23_06550 [Solemya velum gill symbiont]OOZ10066.1 hypothetical protein BOW24_06960 [Solemya velum gill symbiont]